MERAGHPVPGFPDIRIHATGPSRPWRWLGAGWRDLRRAPALSLFYGVVFALVGYLILGLAGQRPYLVTASVSGFFLLAPFLALGLYQISRRLEAGERPTLTDSLTAWRVNLQSIGLFAAFLAFAFILWERLSAILFALFYGRHLPQVEAFTGWLFLLGDRPAFLVAYIVGGAVLAALVFALTVVAIPMLLDRPTDPVTAAVTSLRVVIENPRTLLLWAAIIVVLTLAGIATLFLGLIVTMPLLGHATWHAYRELVEPEHDSTDRR